MLVECGSSLLGKLFVVLAVVLLFPLSASCGFAAPFVCGSELFFTSLLVFGALVTVMFILTTFWCSDFISGCLVFHVSSDFDSCC